MLSNKELLQKYLRHDKKFPHLWCPGCGNGTILHAMLIAIDNLGYAKDDIAMISGIGCSGRTPVYVDFNTLHTTHGRALAFATGLKLAKPTLNVIVIMGDGDATAIGGNHFIHACRRNIDMTAIIYNNNIYGMTGGQYSPTTPHTAKSTTSKVGNIERPFDISALAESAGATFVARSTTYHVRQLIGLIEKALQHKGFSCVEVITHCPTTYGRRNKMPDPVAMVKWEKEIAIPIEQASKISPEEIGGKITTGILVEKEFPEYCEQYEEIIKKKLKPRSKSNG
jgi:2-oxoglutarate ferredoxin oxidoreductase subunit beta